MKNLAVLAFLFFIANPIHTANAHVPYFEKQDSTLNQPFLISGSIEKSIAIYSHFSKANDTDVVKFTIKDNNAQNKLHVSSLVPGCKALKNILPSILIVGPRQSALPLLKSPHPDVKIKGNQSAVLITNTEQGKYWYEPYSRKGYYQQNGIDIILDEPGDYLIVTWETQGKDGDYVLEVGAKEIWSVWDILKTLGAMPRLWLDLEIDNAACRKEL